jgi:tetratricopeptide (TPR) repeat protein
MTGKRLPFVQVIYIEEWPPRRETTLAKVPPSDGYGAEVVGRQDGSIEVNVLSDSEESALNPLVTPPVDFSSKSGPLIISVDRGEDTPQLWLNTRRINDELDSKAIFLRLGDQIDPVGSFSWAEDEAEDACEEAVVQRREHMAEKLRSTKEASEGTRVPSQEEQIEALRSDRMNIEHQMRSVRNGFSPATRPLSVILRKLLSFDRENALLFRLARTFDIGLPVFVSLGDWLPEEIADHEGVKMRTPELSVIRHHEGQSLVDLQKALGARVLDLGPDKPSLNTLEVVRDYANKLGGAHDELEIPIGIDEASRWEALERSGAERILLQVASVIVPLCYYVIQTAQARKGQDSVIPFASASSPTDILSPADAITFAKSVLAELEPSPMRNQWKVELARAFQADGKLREAVEHILDILPPKGSRDPTKRSGNFHRCVSYLQSLYGQMDDVVQASTVVDWLEGVPPQQLDREEFRARFAIRNNAAYHDRNSGQLETARKQYELIIEEASDAPTHYLRQFSKVRALRGLSGLALEACEFGESISYSNDLISIASDEPVFRESFGKAISRKAKAKLSYGDREGAAELVIELVEEAEKWDDESLVDAIEFAHSMSLTISNAGDNKSALRIAQRLTDYPDQSVKLRPALMARIWQNAGFLLEQLDREEEALQVYERAHEISEDALPTLEPLAAVTFNIGNLHRTEGRQEVAQNQFSKVIDEFGDEEEPGVLAHVAKARLALAKLTEDDEKVRQANEKNIQEFAGSTSNALIEVVAKAKLALVFKFPEIDEERKDALLREVESECNGIQDPRIQTQWLRSVWALTNRLREQGDVKDALGSEAGLIVKAPEFHHTVTFDIIHQEFSRRTQASI